MIYLASPYSHEDPAIRQARYEAVRAFTCELLQQRKVIFSPIVYCHGIAVELGLPTDASYWKSFNMTFLRKADALYVLKLEGWEYSAGVKVETATAGLLAIPVLYFENLCV
jgi:hypothetical protein